MMSVFFFKSDEKSCSTGVCIHVFWHVINEHHWFSGKISACHAGASGSIIDNPTSSVTNEYPE